MTHTYNIDGMTCTNCVAKVKSELLKLGDVTESNVQLQAPQATITMQKHVPIETLQSAIKKAGNYTLTEDGNGMHHTTSNIEESRSWLQIYKPILLIFFYVSIVTIIA